jgi:hypothetical protein
MVQPGVTEDDSRVSEVGDEKHLNLFFVALSYSQFDVPLNDSSFVFHPVHVIDLSWSREEHCLDFEGFGKLPVNEVFSGSAIYESFLFGHAA